MTIGLTKKIYMSTIVQIWTTPLLLNAMLKDTLLSGRVDIFQLQHLVLRMKSMIILQEDILLLSLLTVLKGMMETTTTLHNFGFTQVLLQSSPIQMMMH